MKTRGLYRWLSHKNAVFETRPRFHSFFLFRFLNNPTIMASRNFSPKWLFLAIFLGFYALGNASGPSWTFTLGTTYAASFTDFSVSYAGMPFPTAPSWYVEFGDGRYEKSIGNQPPDHVYAAAGAYPITVYGKNKNDNAPPAKVSTTVNPPSGGTTSVPILPAIEKSWNVTPDQETLFPVTVTGCDKTFQILTSGPISLTEVYFYENIGPGVWTRSLIPVVGGFINYASTTANPTFFLKIKSAPNTLGQTYKVTVACKSGDVVATESGKIAAFPYDPNGKSADIELLTEASPPPTVTYQIGFENIGLAPAKDVEVVDNLVDPHFLTPITGYSLPSSCMDASTISGAFCDFYMKNLFLAADSSDHLEFSVATKELHAGDVIENTADIVFYDENGNPMDAISTNTAKINVINCSDFSAVSLDELANLSYMEASNMLLNGSLSIDFLYYAFQNGYISEGFLYQTLFSAYKIKCVACNCCAMPFETFWNFFQLKEVPLPALWTFLFVGENGYSATKLLFENPPFHQENWARRARLLDECAANGAENRQSIAAKSAENLVKISPNPASAMTEIQFSIDSKTGSTVHLSILDLSGRQIANPIQHQFFVSGKYAETLDLSHFSTGIYILRLQTDQEIRTVKLCKQ
jgi:hypothetical protein